MKLRDKQLLLGSLIIVLVILPLFSFISPFLPERHDNYFALAVLGEENKTERYFGDLSSLSSGDAVNWNIYLRNNMNDFAYVILKVKLLNDSMIGPDTDSCEPSLEPSLYEYRTLLNVGEERFFPLSWSLNIINEDSSISQIEMNSYLLNSSVPGNFKKGYRVVIELWSYDEDLDDFIFGWNEDNKRYCVWNQVWFNVTKSN